MIRVVITNFLSRIIGMTSPVPAIYPELILDSEAKQILYWADHLWTPKPAWYLTLAHNPEIAKAYAAFWDITQRGGRVEHSINELMQIAT